MRAVLQKFDKKVWSYQELARIRKLFDVERKVTKNKIERSLP